MNYDSDAGRESLKTSLRNTVSIMRNLGVPLDVLIDVIDAVLTELKDQQQKQL